jgi:hypothetical protein
MSVALSPERGAVFDPTEIMETVLCDFGATAFNPGMW